MDFLQLQYFKAIAKHQHLTKASEELHITQPALSRALARLEKELDVQLFDRKGRNLHLNRYGQILLRHTDSILAEVAQIPLSIASEKQQTQKSLSIGSVNSAFTTDWIADFYMQNTDISIKHRIVDERSIYEQLIANRLDFAIHTAPPTSKKISYLYLMKDKFQILAPYQHWLSKCTDGVYFAEVADVEFIAQTQTNPPHRFIDYMAKHANFMPNIKFEGNAEYFSALYKTMKCCLLILESTAHYYKKDMAEYGAVIDIKDSYAVFDIIVSWQTLREQEAAHACFIDFLHRKKREVEEENRSGAFSL